MEPKYSFLCDYASAEPSGKVNVLGIFEEINCLHFPAVHPVMTYVASVKFAPSETGPHPFKVTFIDYDGKDVLPPFEGNVEVRPGAPTFNITLPISNMKIEKPGVLQIDLIIDGRIVFSNPVNIRQVTRASEHRN